MKFSRLTYIAFFTAVILRLIVLFSSRPYVYGGDSYSYIALSAEISANHYLIPFTNLIHYPGSDYIFPPVIPYFLSLFTPVMNTFGLLEFLPPSFPATDVTINTGKLPRKISMEVRKASSPKVFMTGVKSERKYGITGGKI